MPADGSLEKRDTTPAPPVRRVRGIQSERDGALIPDAYGELPWPMVRVDGASAHDYLERAALRHQARQCMGGECGEFGLCARHGSLDDEHAERRTTVGEAALQMQVIMREAIALTGSHERDARVRLIEDIIHELRFAMGAP